MKNTLSFSYELLFKNQCDDYPLTFIQRALYNLRNYNDIAHIISGSELNCEQKRFIITEIIHNETHLANILASRSHNGIQWNSKSVDKIIRGLEMRFKGGRGMELALCEAMLRQENGNILHRKMGFSFLPAKELDTEYKIDMISRVPVFHPEKLTRTIAFGTQITVVSIYDDNGNITEMYQKKYHQIKNIVPILHQENIQKEIQKTYGPISTPNIISLLAINGKLRKTFTHNSNYIETKFHEWKREGFQSEGILDFFKAEYKNDLMLIAKMLQEEQSNITQSDFLQKIQKDFSYTKKICNQYEKHSIFKKNTNELSIILKKENEILMKAIFFFDLKDFLMLQQMHSPK